MKIKILLLLVYFLFCFFVCRLFDAISFVRNSGSFAPLNPTKLKVKQLKEILEYRDIVYNMNNVVEKSDIVELVKSSGILTNHEILGYSFKSVPTTVDFISASHLMEELLDAKTTAWLIFFTVDYKNDRPVVKKTIWRDIVSTVSKYGIRTGRFSCTSFDRKVCNEKGWTSSRLLFIVPLRPKDDRPEKFFAHEYLPSTDMDAIAWVRNHLNKGVHKFGSTGEIQRWMEYSNKMFSLTSTIRVIFFSYSKSCPLFFAALSVKFIEGMDFGIVDVSRNKDIYKKFVNDFPVCLIITPESVFTYGSRKGESFTFESMRIFLKSLYSDTNDFLWWSFIIINILASFELFILYLSPWKHFCIYFWRAMKYNFIFLSFAFIFAYFFPFEGLFSSCVRIVSSTYIGSIIRHDYQVYYSFFFILISFVLYATTAGYYAVRYELINFDEENEFLSIESWSDFWDCSSRFFNYLRTRAPVRITRIQDTENREADAANNTLLMLERFFFNMLVRARFDYLENLPRWRYRRDHAPSGALELDNCTVCFNDFTFDDLLCGLPCGHNFHEGCIITWLRGDNHSCVICRWPSYRPKN